MPLEIERKFLTQPGIDWSRLGTGQRICQGYLSRDKARTVRVRIRGDQAFITVKGENQGISRCEFEYPIPLADAEILLNNLCERPLIDKTRYEIDHQGHRWEVDVFHGENSGLVIAEIELQGTEEAFSRPHWLDREVSEDPRYFNSNLSQTPFRDWPEADRAAHHDTP